MKRVLSIFFLMTVIALPGRSVGEVLELDRVVELALERNPGLKAVEERRDEVQAGVREAWADAYAVPRFQPGGPGALQPLGGALPTALYFGQAPASSWPSWSWE
jgi:hypothetical protein